MEEEEEVHVVGMISLILEASLNPWSFLSIKKKLPHLSIGQISAIILNQLFKLLQIEGDSLLAQWFPFQLLRLFMTVIVIA